MATLQDLQAKRAQILEEIQRRGGKANAPGFVSQLADIDKQINTVRNNPESGQQFNAQSYLAANPDVAAEANRLKSTGDQRSIEQIALDHWTNNGQKEGRQGAYAAAPPVSPPVAPPPVSPPVTDGIDPSGVANPADKSAIDRAKDILGVGEGFGRKLADEFYGDGSLGRVAETNTPEELAAMAQAKKLAETIGIQDPAIAALIKQQQGILGDAQQYSGLETEALNLSRNALAGLDAPEMEALRSQARANITGEGQAAARALAKAQARNQVFGAAATAQNQLLGQNTVREGRNLERDLLVSNIAIKQAAQNAFNQLATNTEANKASRTNAASNTLANTSLTDQNQRNSATLGASGQQSALATSLGDRLRQLQEFNLNQAAAEKAGKIGTILGGIGTIADQRGLLAGEDFANKQYSDSQAVQQRILDLIKQSLSSSKGALA